MATYTKNDLKQYALRALGHPVIEINVSDEQLDDRIDEALEYWKLYHYEGIERMYLKHRINASKIIIYLTDTETAAIYPGRYEYDVLVVDPTRNSKIKIMGGTVILDSTITKING